ncbi:hypothetical protein [[Limnothrix rosea] IAM M-220]|uniref:hypothetical protein n=1 Tax=[Limnothrix rosea] IAM M-220 TaxID=454133 RepID=UPI000961AA60|nr:hypothetical protein [[Limnothrix rosea] IAM M-220]OKH15117.1 hypothetical protein NIES208_13050 [[Limnothrix rosea] IAM M-220]
MKITITRNGKILDTFYEGDRHDGLEKVYEIPDASKLDEATRRKSLERLLAIPMEEKQDLIDTLEMLEAEKRQAFEELQASWGDDVMEQSA